MGIQVLNGHWYRTYLCRESFIFLNKNGIFIYSTIYLFVNFSCELLLKLYLTILNHTEYEASTAHVYCISGSANATSIVYFFGTLGRVHSPLYHSKLANNSEHPVLISFVCNFHDQRIERAKFKKKIFKENRKYMYVQNGYLRIEVIRLESNEEVRVPNTAGKRCL